MRVRWKSYVVFAALSILAACADGVTDPAAPLSRPSAAISGAPTGTISAQMDPNLCFDVWGASTDAGTPVKLYGCHGSANQQWTATAAGELRIYGAMCLDASSGDGKDGDALIIWPCHGGANQKWQSTAAGELAGVNGRCAGISGAVATSGATAALHTCHGGEDQKWNAPVLTAPSAPAPAPATPSGTVINPGDNIQAMVNARPQGTAFVLKAGVHRLQSVQPKAGNSFTGEPGAVMSGARLLTTFAREGGYWVASGQTQQGAVAGQCSGGAPRCSRPEQLFIDDVLLTHVATLSSVAPGKWYFDYDADKIYFADDPTGRRVETSVIPFAFDDGGGSGVTIRNLVIEKYATPGDQATIRGVSSTDWLIEGSELRWNQGIALAARTRWRIVRNNVHHNGQVGVAVGGTSNDGTVIESNEVAYNNTAGYEKYWQAGGMKLLRTKNLTVRDNYVHHNAGYGVWTDYNNDAVLIEGNRVTDNAMAGIYHEVSARAVIRNNIAERNGTSAGPTGTDAAGIVVDNSHGVEIYGNTVTDNRGGGIVLRQVNRTDLPAAGGPYGPYQLHDVYVHDNTVTLRSGTNGVVQYVGDPSYWTGRNNRFAANRYVLGSATGYFAWQGGTALTESQWRAAGQDVAGTFAR